MIWERRFKVRLWKSVVEDRGDLNQVDPILAEIDLLGSGASTSLVCLALSTGQA